MENPLHQEVSAEHWGELSALLSLDFLEPLWREFSFDDTIDFQALRDQIRPAILEFRKEVESGGSHNLSISQRLFADTGSNLKDPIRSFVEMLGLSGYCSSHQHCPVRSAWQISMMNFPADFPVTQKQLGVEKTAKAVSLRDAFNDTFPVPRSLSQWDLSMCARHGWNPESEDYFLPVDAVLNALAIRNAVQSVLAIRVALDDTSFNQFVSEADQVIENMGVWMPEDVALWPMEIA